MVGHWFVAPVIRVQFPILTPILRSSRSGYLVGLISQRSLVRIHPPQPFRQVTQQLEFSAYIRAVVGSNPTLSTKCTDNLIGRMSVSKTDCLGSSPSLCATKYI